MSKFSFLKIDPYTKQEAFANFAECRKTKKSLKTEVEQVWD